MGYHGICVFSYEISVGISSVLATIEGQIWWKKLNIIIYSDRVEWNQLVLEWKKLLLPNMLSQPQKAFETGVFGNTVAWNEWKQSSWWQKPPLPTWGANRKKRLKLACLAILWLGTNENAALGVKGGHLSHGMSQAQKCRWNQRLSQYCGLEQMQTQLSMPEATSSNMS